MTALAAGAVLGVPGTLGVVLTTQVNRVRRGAVLPRPGYVVDLLVDPPWVTGDPLDVAFLGDSLVEGVGAPRPGQSLPAQTAYRLAAHLGRPVRMRGHGVASSRISDVLADQVPRLGPEVDLVLVLVGANDATGGTPPWEFARRVEALAVTAHERTDGAPVVFTGLPSLGTAPLLPFPLRDVASAVGDTLHAVQRRLAVRLPEARYIDVRCEVGDTMRRRARELFADDRYHPNPAGYALIGEGIARAVAHLLAEDRERAADESSAAQLEDLRRQAMADLSDLPGMPAA